MRRQFFSTSKIGEEDDKDAITCESTLVRLKTEKNGNQVHPAKRTRDGTTSRADDRSFVGFFYSKKVNNMLAVEWTVQSAS